ncbi:MAG TPA: anthranilate phosphoribosyltransferase [Verrucomicrobiales bacterium]|nr:anthranilate phosphoribosyltransferase [Verrucomicrobiales bacterium]
MRELTEIVERGGILDEAAVEAAAAALLEEDCPAEEKAEFLSAWRRRGETAEEIAGLVRIFLDRAVDPGLHKESVEGPLIDVCGTGGDALDLFNVSTTAMFVLAAGGAVVVKHGNRGITSKSGGADVLEALGIPVDSSAATFREMVRRAGVGFLFAPMYHPAFRAVAPVRKLLADRGEKSVFNLLGPLLNPVQPDYQLAGVFDAGLTRVFAEILRSLGRKKAWAVHGQTENGGGVDELSTMGPSQVAESGPAGQREWTVYPGDAGLQSAMHADLTGGTAKENAGILLGVLAGAERGPRRDLTVFNAAGALIVAGLAADLEEGRARAEEAIDSGGALERLRAMQALAATR